MARNSWICLEIAEIAENGLTLLEIAGNSCWKLLKILAGNCVFINSCCQCVFINSCWKLSTSGQDTLAGNGWKLLQETAGNCWKLLRETATTPPGHRHRQAACKRFASGLPSI